MQPPAKSVWQGAAFIWLSFLSLLNSSLDIVDYSLEVDKE